MWQLLLAAALAGSTTLLLQHFLGRDPKDKGERSPPPPQASIGGFCTVFADSDDSGRDLQGEEVFRFSSSGDSSRKVNRTVRRRYSRRLKFGGDNHNADKRSGGSEGNPKRFLVCLKKKRRTAKYASSKCGSRPSQDGSLFGCVLGVGIMYMMSARKAEIGRLSTAMDETSKAVQELNNEMYKRKSTQMNASSNNLINQNKQLVRYELGTLHRDTRMSGVSLTDEIECPSSVLTEEAEPQGLGMDQLEAELATELQKLPWCGESFGHERLEAHMAENDERGGIYEFEGEYTCRNNGVLASELDQKLCHLLIEQQENQIKELQSELQSAQSKLKEKEAELQALKDCVRRLTEFSLSNVSDDEAEIQSEQDNFSERDNNSNIMESEYAPRVSTVGMKRSIYIEWLINPYLGVRLVYANRKVRILT